MIDDGCCTIVYRGDPSRMHWAELEGLEVFDQVGDLTLEQSEPEKAIVVFDHIAQPGEATVVVEASFLVRPETSQWRCTIALIGGTVGLEVVDTDLGSLIWHRLTSFYRSCHSNY